MLGTVHGHGPHLVGHAVDHSAAAGGLCLGTVNTHQQAAPLGHILNVDVAGLVLRGKRGVDNDVVDGQTHRLVGAAATGHTDVPGQIQVAAGGNVHHELLAVDGSSADGDHLGTDRGGIRGKIGVEVIACAVPVDTIGRDVKLHGKAGGIIAVAVLLDVVVQRQLGDGLVAGIVQACHHADAAGATVDRGRQAAHRAVAGHTAGSEVPGAVLGIAGQAGAASVHDSGRSIGIAAHGAGRVHLALHTPSLRHVERCCLGIAVPHAVKILGHLGGVSSDLQCLLGPQIAAPCASQQHDNGKID